jgi:CPA2 family monovalent cation:H+ antiporter-2
LIHGSLLFEIILLLGLTAAGLAIFERLRLPAIAGFLVVGAIAGPGVLGLVPEPERVHTLAEFGVIFLLFEIGLDLPLERARRLWRESLLAGGIQVGLTLGAVFGCSLLLGLDAASAFVLGGVVAMSSTALVLRLLTDQGQVTSPHGRLTTSVLVFQDLSIVPLLLVVPMLAAPADASPLILINAVLKAVVALAVVYVVMRFAVPRVLNRMTRLRSTDLFSLLALLIVLGSAFLAEELGLTLAVGAFLAGMAASSSLYAQRLFSEVVPLRGVVLGIFFTAVGMLFDPVVVIDHAPVVLGILVASTLLKATIVTTICSLVLGHGLRISILTGIGLAQIGEFSFVLAAAAAAEGVLEPGLHQSIVAASSLSLILTPFLLRLAPALSDWASRLSEGLRRAMGEDPGTPLCGDRAGDPGRVIVIGFGPGGRTLVTLLRSLHIPYLIVDTNAGSVQEASALGEPIIYGDATSPAFLERLGVEGAKLVAIAISDPLATRRIVGRLRALAPEVPILARARFVFEVDALEDAGASQVVAEEFEGGLELVTQALGLFDYGPRAIRNFTDALREDHYGVMRSSPDLAIDPWLLELLHDEEPEWLTLPDGFRDGPSLAELDIRARTGASILAVERAGGVDSVPEAGFRLQSGDRLLVLGDPSSLESLRSLLTAEPCSGLN